jgi:hypothetical protein
VFDGRQARTCNGAELQNGSPTEAALLDSIEYQSYSNLSAAHDPHRSLASIHGDGG